VIKSGLSFLHRIGRISENPAKHKRRKNDLMWRVGNCGSFDISVVLMIEPSEFVQINSNKLLF
jgi:hypothetical protein